MSPEEPIDTSQAAQGQVGLQISASLAVPDDHAILYANTVNLSFAEGEVFLDFFVLDAHLQDGQPQGRAHFVSRVVLNPRVIEPMLQMLQFFKEQQAGGT